MSGLEDIKVESREGAGGGVVREVSEPQDYDVKFLKERDEALNSTITLAGLFSVVISAFIVYTSPQLQPNPNEESAALLRVLLFKFDNTIFGGDVPQVPHWTGPSYTIIMTQSLLYLSLAATLASTFFAILAKQLSDRYTFDGSQDSNMEQGRAPERRLRCSSVSLRVVHLVLPLLLQSALLLFSCAVSVYLWKINTVIAAIIPIVTFCTIQFCSPFGASALTKFESL